MKSRVSFGRCVLSCAASTLVSVSTMYALPSAQDSYMEDANQVAVTNRVQVYEADVLIGKDWQLVDLCGKEVSGRRPITLRFDVEERVVGTSFVNRFFGSFTLKDGVLSVSRVGSTSRIGPPEMMEDEQTYLTALGNAKSVTMIGDDQLVIEIEGQELPLKFKLVK